MPEDAPVYEEDGRFVAYDDDADVVGQGASREEAPSSLAAALEIHTLSAPQEVPPGVRDVPEPEVDWF